MVEGKSSIVPVIPEPRLLKCNLVHVADIAEIEPVKYVPTFWKVRLVKCVESVEILPVKVVLQSYMVQ